MLGALKVSIVVLNYNGWEDTIQCLSSIESQRIPPSRVILVDNASRDDRCPEIQARFPQATIIRNRQNRGFAGGNNDGIRLALEEKPDILFLLNNDTVISPDTVDLLADASARFPRYGIIGPIINYMDEPEIVRTDGCLFNLPGGQGFFTRKVIAPSVGELTISPTDIVNGCAMAVRRNVFEQIGLLDESYFIVHEESDFCLRAARAGFPNGILNRILVRHKGSSSFQREGKEHQRYYDSRNLLRLLRRYGKTNGRSFRASSIGYLRYVYYRFCHEAESGNGTAALACAAGLVDAILGRTGPRPDGSPSIASRGLAGLFSLTRLAMRIVKPANEFNAHTGI